MTTGIYQLTFGDDSTYIGKSINIEKRWEQHRESFLRDTAARPLQRAYVYFGEPDKHIIMTCSPDHIDVLEAHFIARCRPELNTQQMKDPFEDIDDITEFANIFQMSTMEHIFKMGELIGTCQVKDDEIRELMADITEYQCTVEEHKRTIDTLLITRSNEELQGDIANRITKLLESNKEFKNRANKAEGALNSYLALPWWKRIFAK